MGREQNAENPVRRSLLHGNACYTLSFNFLLCKLSFFLSPAIFADYFFANFEEFPNSLLHTFVTLLKSAQCKTLMRFLWEVFLKMAVVAIPISLTFDMKCSKWIYMAFNI